MVFDGYLQFALVPSDACCLFVLGTQFTGFRRYSGAAASCYAISQPSNANNSTCDFLEGFRSRSQPESAYLETLALYEGASSVRWRGKPVQGVSFRYRIGSQVPGNYAVRIEK